jgi:hypothetical protein
MELHNTTTAELRDEGAYEHGFEQEWTTIGFWVGRAVALFF